jgi:hypothetical protein
MGARFAALAASVISALEAGPLKHAPEIIFE